AQVLVDGSDTSVQAAAAQLAQVPVPGLARGELARTPGEALSSVPDTPRAIGVVGFYNPERRTQLFVVPGLVGVILTMTMVLFTAVSVVREHERGNMELLMATPITRAELLIGKVLPYVAIGLVQATLV